MTAATSPSRLVRIAAGDHEAFVYPEQGFQLHRYTVRMPDGRVLDVIHGPNGVHEPADRRYGNPVLFPAVGITKRPEGDLWQWGTTLWPMPAHGVARNSYWQVESISDDAVTAVLVPNNGTRVSFPFEFELRLRYGVSEHGLDLQAELRNTGDVPFPFALGFHPYLHAPLTGGSRSQTEVTVPNGVRARSNDGWQTIQREPQSAGVINGDDADLPGSILLETEEAHSLELRHSDAKLITRVSAVCSAGAPPVWVIWSAGPEAPYLCLEPWTDLPNALNRATTLTLAAGASFHMELRVAVEGAT